MKIKKYVSCHHLVFLTFKTPEVFNPFSSLAGPLGKSCQASTLIRQSHVESPRGLTEVLGNVPPFKSHGSQASKINNKSFS